MAFTQQELINDLIVSVAKDHQLKETLEKVLSDAGHTATESARVAFALLEIAVESFRKHGISPCTLAPMLQLKAHGATSDRILKMLMQLQSDDELREDVTKKVTVN